MGYQSTRECLAALEAKGDLVRIKDEIDPYLEAAAVQRRVFAAGGPALCFERVKDSPFPMAANLFGTVDRVQFIFRDTLRAVESLLLSKADPMAALRRFWRHWRVPLAMRHALPRISKHDFMSSFINITASKGMVMRESTTLSTLPQLVSWPGDGGAYVTLPQVYTEDPARPGYMHSNLGMYRVQISGQGLEPDKEAGLHYQIHRGIAAHHAEALRRGEELAVNVFVGGPPAMTMAAMMPLPEGVPELLFAGVLGGERADMLRLEDRPLVAANADFCIHGVISPRTNPEGPFGDHLGYYSLAHDFPVMRVIDVTHRPGAVWPFTTVGRPRQEDSVLGAFAHRLTRDLVPTIFPGVREVHAVDAAGVHPLLLAVGSERYVPWAEERIPQELLTNAMALLGNTQTSLSKYVVIAAREDDDALSAQDVPGFFRHVLERIDLARDLHFITRTTMDTLDYSGISLNQGSKAIIAAAGEPRRELGLERPDVALPPGFTGPAFFAPGILVVGAPKHDKGRDEPDPLMEGLARALEAAGGLSGFPLVVAVDDVDFAAANWDNFLWVAFTRSDPATDSYGAGARTHAKHWGCAGPLVIDARLKTYHAPPLEPDPAVEKRVDRMGESGGPLHGII